MAEGDSNAEIQIANALEKERCSEKKMDSDEDFCEIVLRPATQTENNNIEEKEEEKELEFED